MSAGNVTITGLSSGLGKQDVERHLCTFVSLTAPLSHDERMSDEGSGPPHSRQRSPEWGQWAGRPGSPAGAYLRQGGDAPPQGVEQGAHFRPGQQELVSPKP